MSFGSRLREARQQKKFTQKQLGDLLGVSDSSIGGYENGLSSPSTDLLLQLMAALSVDANYLYQDELQSKDFFVNADETELIYLYRGAEDYARTAAKKLLGTAQVDPVVEFPAVVDKIVYTFPSAAGIPMFAEDDFEHMEFPADQVPKGADFGVRIQGDSMEPTISDGSIVWVRKAVELQNGQIGIFMIDDSAVCKRFYKKGGRVRLESDNESYEPIMVHEYERFGIVGRVLEYR